VGTKEEDYNRNTATGTGSRKEQAKTFGNLALMESVCREKKKPAPEAKKIAWTGGLKRFEKPEYQNAPKKRGRNIMLNVDFRGGNK